MRITCSFHWRPNQKYGHPDSQTRRGCEDWEGRSGSRLDRVSWGGQDLNRELIPSLLSCVYYTDRASYDRSILRYLGISVPLNVIPLFKSQPTVTSYMDLSGPPTRIRAVVPARKHLTVNLKFAQTRPDPLMLFDILIGF
jgi:hypothetical protein